MRLAIIGLGKMGGNMARRLCRGGIEVVGYNRSSAIVEQLASEEGMLPAGSVEDAVSQLTSPRIVWLMLPSGDPTEEQIHAHNLRKVTLSSMVAIPIITTVNAAAPGLLNRASVSWTQVLPAASGDLITVIA